MTASQTAGAPLLRTANLNKWYGRDVSALGRATAQSSTRLHAVADVTLEIMAGQTIAVVGETGSGKSTLGRLVVRLEEPTSGEVYVEGTSMMSLSRQQSKVLRRTVQIILQDPYSTLNPYRTVAQSIGEVLRVHGMRSASERDAETDRLLSLVGFPLNMSDRVPGQLSGGGRQRVSIARALAVRPKLIVADEPVSALDASVQAQVLNLFEKLRDELGLAYLFITHDLAVVERLADRIAVMYLGRIVEEGAAEDVLSNPQHPYTRALLDAAPRLGGRPDRNIGGAPALTGDMPNPIDPPPGCVFHPRCPAAVDICRTTVPVVSTPMARHRVVCHLRTSSDALAGGRSHEGDVAK
ncbi:MAG: ATP-binding cassette domain-containing protein [Propionibacteriaceae bacterium]|nr:ATP-binding cassette domain-containing protein [Propionibacteriaceae bacterium]